MSGSVLVTGGTGFVGHAVAMRLQSHGWEVVAPMRSQCVELPMGVRVASGLTLDARTDWSSPLKRVRAVVHCAGRAHVMKDEMADPLAEYRRVNVEGTLNLARQAAAAGVERFVFISSIKVNGERTTAGRRFREDDAPAPEDAYGMSKAEAEQGLRDLARETHMTLTVIRPPLVYGRGAKGNFATLSKLVASGLPLPLGAIHNQRTMVALDNLVDLIVTCIDHPAAANQVFLAGDGNDLSTTQLVCGMARAMGRRPRLYSVPDSLLMLGATLVGKRSAARRFLGCLQVDISKARTVLGWDPPVSVEEGLKRCFE